MVDVESRHAEEKQRKRREKQHPLYPVRCIQYRLIHTCELVDRLFSVKRVGVDGKITQVQCKSGLLLSIEGLRG